LQAVDIAVKLAFVSFIYYLFLKLQYKGWYEKHSVGWWNIRQIPLNKGLSHG